MYQEINLKISKLNGMKVITADAFTLGEVEGTRADIDKWKITNLEVSLTKETIKELGFKKPLPILGSMLVCLPVTAVKTIGDVIALKHTLEEFKNLKECSAE